MVRAGLGQTWKLALANDIDPMKCAAYRANWGGDGLVEADIRSLRPDCLSGSVDLVWASSPCQDLSLAGKRMGLSGKRSSMFDAWIDLLRAASRKGSVPRILAFENVTGLLSSGGGRDFFQVISAFTSMGYKTGALEINASHFLPQSRPRLFVVAVHQDVQLDNGIVSDGPTSAFHTQGVKRAFLSLSDEVKKHWVWWKIPSPQHRKLKLEDVINPYIGDWYSNEQTRSIICMMDSLNRQKLKSAIDADEPQIGFIYKRGRPDSSGTIRQRAEVRFDGLAGCLRTPGGGSSRQTVVFVDRKSVRMRLLSTIEAGGLMGLNEYQFPDRYNDAYRICGDGVAVPIISHLRDHLFEPVLRSPLLRRAA